MFTGFKILIFLLFLCFRANVGNECKNGYSSIELPKIIVEKSSFLVSYFKLYYFSIEEINGLILFLGGHEIASSWMVTYTNECCVLFT